MGLRFATLAVAGMFALLCASSCATTRGGFDYAKEPDPRSSEYIVGPADLLRINVWRDTELSMELRVRPDGTITLPLLGDIRAAGRTPTQIRDEIGKRLTEFVKSE